MPDLNGKTLASDPAGRPRKYEDSPEFVGQR